MTRAPNLGDFPRAAHDKIRYADTDRQGHVNNAVFATLAETGRVELLYDPDAPIAGPDGEFVIARLALDFRGEIQWPGTVEIGTGVKKVGRSSVTLAQAFFQDGRLVAEVETVIVQIHRGTRAALPLTDVARGRLEALELADGDADA